MNNLNPPRTVRAAVYLLTALGTPLVAYLNAKGIIGATEVTFWSAEVAVAGGLAALNTSTNGGENEPVRTVAVRKVDEAEDVQW